MYDVSNRSVVSSTKITRQVLHAKNHKTLDWERLKRFSSQKRTTAEKQIPGDFSWIREEIYVGGTWIFFVQTKSEETKKKQKKL